MRTKLYPEELINYLIAKDLIDPANVKMQRVVYFVFKNGLKENLIEINKDNCLFQAWSFGPTNPAAWNRFQKWQDGEFAREEIRTELVAGIDMNRKLQQLIIKVFRTVQQYDREEVISKSKDSAWVKARRGISENMPCTATLDNTDIIDAEPFVILK